MPGAQVPSRSNGSDGGGSGRGVPAPVWQGEPGRHPGGLLPSDEPLPHRRPPAGDKRDATASRTERPPRGATYVAPATPRRWIPGDRAEVRVTVTDTGQQPWRARDIALGARWYRPDGSEYAYRRGEQPVDHLAALPRDLAPGESAEVRADVRAPALLASSPARSSLLLAWDLYDRRGRVWLSDAEPPSGPVRQARERVVVERSASDRLGLARFYRSRSCDESSGTTRHTPTRTFDTDLRCGARVGFGRIGRCGVLGVLRENVGTARSPSWVTVRPQGQPRSASAPSLPPSTAPPGSTPTCRAARR